MDNHTVDRSLYRAEEGFVPFPDADAVFANRIREHSEYLLPAATLSLSQVSPDLSGKVHFILPIEPCSGWGLLGELSTPWHNHFCRQDWLAYRMVGDHCELMTDFRFFHKAYFAERPPVDPHQIQEASEMESHYAINRAAFQLRKDFYLRHGWLHHSPESWKPTDKEEYYRAALVDQIGGVPRDGNWSGNGWESSLPISRYPDPEYFQEPRPDGPNPGLVYPRTEGGRDLIFVGSVSCARYLGDSNGYLLLFFDSVDRIAVSVFDWD